MDRNEQIEVLQKELNELKNDNKRLFQMVERLAKMREDIDRLFIMVQRITDITMPQNKYEK